ncbi:ferritin family protein [Acetanaerobacterium elongatum]|uniref:Rubrerythrin n=1 Tax=Acetanaerobacterium elongatum TaxID=258515 RepID=A0A1H0GIP0_9FIRM|nr:ferritin family protein [Acetanaerobacterium elongatum]SDO06807.1 Rubrerythrin [Acetanaerobacterium elongatum]
MVQTTCQRLRTYIDAELKDAALYRELAKKAPVDDAMMLLEFAQDEQRHAEEFQCIYQTMNGCPYAPNVQAPNLNAPYRDILLRRVLDESNDYRKYGDQNLLCPNSPLRNAYCQAQTDENVHALRLLYMLNKSNLNKPETNYVSPATTNSSAVSPATTNSSAVSPATTNSSDVSPATVNSSAVSPAAINPGSVNQNTTSPAIKGK